MNAQTIQKPINQNSSKFQKYEKKKKTALTRAQKTLIDEVLMPIGGLALVLAGAITVAYLFDCYLVHPNLHPRLVKFTNEIIHHHPRIWQTARMAFFGTLVMLPLLSCLTPPFSRYRWLKKSKLGPNALKSDEYLNTTTKQSMPLLLPQAWQTVKDIMPGMFIHIPDVRGTHWELVEGNDNRREMKLVLRYVHDPLAIKPSRLYPRKINCTVKLTGRGTSTEIEQAFSADSAMDYQSVYAIIDQTRASLESAMQNYKDIEASTEAAVII